MFYKNLKLVQNEDGSYALHVLVNDSITQVIKLTTDQLEYIISTYRQAK